MEQQAIQEAKEEMRQAVLATIDSDIATWKDQTKQYAKRGERERSETARQKMAALRNLWIAIEQLEA